MLFIVKDRQVQLINEVAEVSTSFEDRQQLFFKGVSSGLG